MTIDEARERVERGSALLDAKQPGWREKVNPKTLRIEEPCGCILGQVYGNYFAATWHLGLSRQERLGCGFQATPGTVRGAPDYDLLQAAWLEQLRAKP